jgi:hypothetical protein
MCIGESLSLCHVHQRVGLRSLLYRKPHLDAIDCRQIGSSLVRAKDREKLRRMRIYVYNIRTHSAAAAFGHLHFAVAATPAGIVGCRDQFLRRRAAKLSSAERIMELELCERVNN